MTRKIFNTTRKLPTTSDKDIAAWYLKKMQQSEDRNIVFTLSLMSFANIARSTKCYYAKLPLTKNTISIDRIDNNKGYVKGNVVACHKHFNSLKGCLEDPKNALNYKIAFKGMSKLGKKLENI